MNFWISWISHLPLSEFELHSPWWVSGESEGGYDVVCAAIKAESEAKAKRVIIKAYDHPQSLAFRFCLAQPEDWTPFCDRFPQADWMTW